MKQRLCLLLLMTLSVGLGACDLGKVAVGTTSKVLYRGRYAIKQEADFELAQRAIPGSLKTVEAFHMVDPGNPRLTAILSEGFCQYASGFVEDEWELALLDKDFENAEYHSKRAGKMFMRCMGYSLEILGKKWNRAMAGPLDGVKQRLSKTGRSKRNALMWAGVGLAGAINHNKDNPQMLAQLSKAELIISKVLEFDAKKAPKDKASHAFAHTVRAMIYSAKPKLLGGDPDAAKAHFEKAIAITENKFLLPKVLLARRYAVAVQDEALFQKLLVEVLQTDPNIWPEQRLANEIAHRRAKRYLKIQKDFF